MPWSLSKRGSQWCVVKEGESTPVPGGCHATRGQAIKHQRALYANESRMASMYAELDAQTEEYVPAPALTAERAQELKIIVSQENAPNIQRSPSTAAAALTAAVEEMIAANERNPVEDMIVANERSSASLVEAVKALAEKLTAPQITVQPAPLPEVHVDAPQVTVEAPQVTVETPPAPQVTVQNDIVLPSSEKVVRFERDPRSGQLTGATVEETNDISS